MRLLNCEEMKLVEKYTAKYGLSYQRMMENAGAACARNIKNVIENDKNHRRNIVVVCGKGNNGGDGFVVARKFAESGYNTTIVLASGYPASSEAEYMYKMAVDLSIPTVWYDADKIKAVQIIKNSDVIVDAIFGFSFYGNINGDLQILLTEMNSAKGLRFAIDVPSGVYCDSGYKDPNCFVSDYTIAISALKPAHVIHPSSDCCGDIIIANIGIPEESYQFVNGTMYTYNSTEIKNLFPERKITANKGDFGHLLVVCGSKKMPGAAYLSTSAALRSGAGLVTAAFPDCIYNTMSIKLNEALLLPLPSNNDGSFSKDCISELLSVIDRYDAIVFGCGVTVNDDTKALLKAILQNSKVPVIIDADGLNIISGDFDILKSAVCPVILTPHPKEMSRLICVQTELIQADRVNIAHDFSSKNGVHLVLKGSNTVVASPGNDKAYINVSGNNGLSKGGSGDVLAGIIGSLVAQGFSLTDAACVGVYIHGHCADIVADKLSKTGMLPSDIINELAEVFSSFEK